MRFMNYLSLNKIVFYFNNLIMESDSYSIQRHRKRLDTFWKIIKENKQTQYYSHFSTFFLGLYHDHYLQCTVTGRTHLEGRAETDTPVFIKFTLRGNAWRNHKRFRNYQYFITRQDVQAHSFNMPVPRVEMAENHEWYQTRHSRLLAVRFTFTPPPSQVVLVLYLIVSCTTSVTSSFRAYREPCRECRPNFDLVSPQKVTSTRNCPQTELLSKSRTFQHTVLTWQYPALTLCCSEDHEWYSPRHTRLKLVLFILGRRLPQRFYLFIYVFVCCTSRLTSRFIVYRRKWFYLLTN